MSGLKVLIHLNTNEKLHKHYFSIIKGNNVVLKLNMMRKKQKSTGIIEAILSVFFVQILI